MDDSFLVRCLQRFSDLDGDGQSIVRGNSAKLDFLRQRFSRNQLHHEKVAGVDFLYAVYCGDIRVIQRSQHAGFTLESRNTFGIVTECFREEFDRDTAGELRVGGLINVAL